jgi:prepilin-type N-terminal cleavage/methylation domain-containing protein
VYFGIQLDRREEHGMKRDNGFSIIELLVSLVILLIVVAAATSALMQAQQVSDGIAMEANTQENLRAGMHFLVRDLTQAGEGIPQAGISVPVSAAATSLINRPGTAGTFPTSYTVLPQVTPGWEIGQVAFTLDPKTGAVLSGGLQTDVINVLYADNTLTSSAPCVLGAITLCPLSGLPVTIAATVGPPATPACKGVISATGLTVTFDPTCFTMPGSPTPISVGNLMMFQNSNGTALEYVTGVAGQTVTFAAGDPAGLNQTGKPGGTVAQLNVAATPTTITRVWMVTYYLDTTNPRDPQLIRQVNYPNYPSAAAAVNPPQQVADCIENLSFSYDVITNTPGTYGAVGPGDAAQPLAPDTPFNIRAVNVTLAGRSEQPFRSSAAPAYLRNNLSTQVSIRSLAFVNQFPTPAPLP